MKDALRSEGVTIIRKTLNKYITALKDEFTKGMILPKKETSMSANMSKLSLSKGEVQAAAAASAPAKVNGVTSSVGVKLELCDIDSESSMKCTANDVYNALTRPEMFVAFTHGSGQIEPKVGGKFHMFGGNVHGKILELDPPKKIVQDWRFKHWPEGHFSKVTFTIEEKQDSTKVKVHQSGVPASDQEKTREGWDQFYWDAMKRTFGFGSYIL
jgi:activator of HSP90 ATPase